MLAFFYTSAFVSLTSLPLLYWHTALHGLSLLQCGLAVFCCINVMICWWEIGLFLNRALIKQQYTNFKKTLKGAALPDPMFMFEECSLSQALSLKFWSLVWSTYSLIDPSYSDQTTFGFFVDVGNGFTTLLPSILFALCMTWPLLPARIVGIMGLIKFYQEMYGTIIYLCSFILNERYKGKPLTAILIVIISNNIWVVGPLFGLYASYQLVDSNTYEVFRSLKQTS